MFPEFQQVGWTLFVQLLEEVRTSCQVWIMTCTFKTNTQKCSGCFKQCASFVNAAPFSSLISLSQLRQYLRFR